MVCLGFAAASFEWNVKVKRLIAIIAFYIGLIRLFYWLNRRAKRIITFHNVLPDDMQAVGSIGCSEGASEFAAKIDILSGRFKFSTDLDDPKTVTLTFDDGTVNEYEIAGEVLKARNIPAILFVAGDIVDASPKDALITDKILLWNKFAPDSAVAKVFGVNVPRDELWVKYVQPAYREDAASRGKNFLARLEETCTVESLYDKLPSEWVRLRMSGVTGEQLNKLRARGWKIGWHTWSHYPLGMLDDTAKRQDLDSPREYRDVVLSYPYGDIGAIGETSLKIAQEFGYPCAVSNDPYYSPYRGRFFLQRMAFLNANKYEIHFELSGLKYFIQYRRLLPKVEK